MKKRFFRSMSLNLRTMHEEEIRVFKNVLNIGVSFKKLFNIYQVDTEPEQIASGTDATGIWMYKRGMRRFGRQQDDAVTQRGGRLQRRGWRRLIALTEIYQTTPTSPLETSTTLNYGIVLLASTSTHSVLVHPNPSWICSAGDLFRFSTHLKRVRWRSGLRVRWRNFRVRYMVLSYPTFSALRANIFQL